MTRTKPLPDTLTLHGPFRLVRRGGRKEMQLPEGNALSRRPDATLIKALARAFRWKRTLDSGEFATIGDLARREGIARSYVARLIQLTALAPDIVETVVEGAQDSNISTEMLRLILPNNWAEQREMLGCGTAMRTPE